MEKQRLAKQNDHEYHKTDKLVKKNAMKLKKIGLIDSVMELKNLKAMTANSYIKRSNNYRKTNVHKLQMYKIQRREDIDG